VIKVIYERCSSIFWFRDGLVFEPFNDVAWDHVTPRQRVTVC